MKKDKSNKKSEKECCHEGKCHKGHKLGLVIGTVLGINVVLLALAANIGLGQPIVRLLSSLYIGYDMTFKGAIIGGIWGFLDGYVFGYLIGFFKKKFFCCKNN
jgi:hypothetical protein